MNEDITSYTSSVQSTVVCYMGQDSCFVRAENQLKLTPITEAVHGLQVWLDPGAQMISSGFSHCSLFIS